MAIKVYKEGYNLVVDNPSLNEKTYTPAIFTRMKFSGDNCLIWSVIKGESLYNDDVSNMYDSAGTLIGDKLDVETYLLSFIGSGDSTDSELSKEILFYDLFTGTSLDTTLWDETIDTGVNVAFTQDDKMSVVFDGDTAESALINNLIGDDVIDLGDISVITFDLTQTTQGSGSWGVGITKDKPLTGNQDRIAIQSAAATTITPLLKQGGSNTYSTAQTLDITTAKTIKMVIGASSMTWNYWDGSAWVQLATSSHSSSGNWYPMIFGTDVIEAVSPLIVENYRITGSDFTTQRP